VLAEVGTAPLMAVLVLGGADAEATPLAAVLPSRLQVRAQSSGATQRKRLQPPTTYEIGPCDGDATIGLISNTSPPRFSVADRGLTTRTPP
jgi:hypothetical protein